MDLTIDCTSTRRWTIEPDAVADDVGFRPAATPEWSK